MKKNHGRLGGIRQTPGYLQKQPYHLPEETGVQLLRAASYDICCRYLDTDQTSTEQTCGCTDQNGKEVCSTSHTRIKRPTSGSGRGQKSSNYNRTNDVAVCVAVCVWPCVWQPTPKTADVTVTKIAGYVRVRILMNRLFFLVFLPFIVVTLSATFLNTVYEYACNELMQLTVVVGADWTLHPCMQ